MQVQIGLLILLFGLYYLSRLAIKKKNLNLCDIKNDKLWINHLNKLSLFDKEYDNKLLRIEHFKESLEYLEYEALGKIKKLLSN